MKKLTLKESVEGGETALRGSVSAPEGFSKGKPLAAKLMGRSPRVFFRQIRFTSICSLSSHCFILQCDLSHCTIVQLEGLRLYTVHCESPTLYLGAV